jgi:hypothetical protein
MYPILRYARGDLMIILTMYMIIIPTLSQNNRFDPAQPKSTRCQRQLSDNGTIPYTQPPIYLSYLSYPRAPHSLVRTSQSNPLNNNTPRPPTRMKPIKGHILLSPWPNLHPEFRRRRHGRVHANHPLSLLYIAAFQHGHFTPQPV